MKPRIIIFFVLIVLSCMTACENSLNTDPLSEVTPDSYFQTAQDLELYTNSFYELFPGEQIYNGDANSDNVMEFNVSSRVRGDRQVPTSGGGWTWDTLRDINFFLDNYQRADDAQAKRQYSGIARFFRAYFYYDKVHRFGDVPWYSEPLTPGDEEALHKERDSRGVVMDSVLSDLDYAIENLPSSTELYTATKWTALALKSRVALFEGTFRKYHGLSNAEKYLNASVDASQELIDSGTYSIYSTGSPEIDYRDLFATHDAIADEVILARQYSAGLDIEHHANFYTVTASSGRPGMPKDMVNSYLSADGSRYTEEDNHNEKPFHEEVQNRDLRLSQTIRTPGYQRIGGTEELAPDLAVTTTGYQLIKYVNEPEYDQHYHSLNDLPLFRYAEVLLNYAEAKAELGSLTQADLDNSVNILRDRVEMPHMNLADANANPDPFLENQYRNVEQGTNKGIILEIRRERRIELYMENFRWDDLMRWKEGQKLTQPFRGMYFPGPGEYNLDQNGELDLVIYDEGDAPSNQQDGVLYLELGEDIVLDNNGLINPQPGVNPEDRSFDENKDYLYPIPRQELQLNENLEQNSGWE